MSHLYEIRDLRGFSILTLDSLEDALIICRFLGMKAARVFRISDGELMASHVLEDVQRANRARWSDADEDPISSQPTLLAPTKKVEKGED